jgi:hypothetical protein
VVVSEKQFYEIARRVERDFEPQFGPDVQVSLLAEDEHPTPVFVPGKRNKAFALPDSFFWKGNLVYSITPGVSYFFVLSNMILIILYT